MKFCIIIPDRGDRPELTEFCKDQLSRMTLQPNAVFHIDYTPVGTGFDLVDRIKAGIDQAKAAGFDLCFVFENDDAYPPDYFKKYEPHFDKFDFFGDEHTYYYNIKTLRWSSFNHKYRSSLFTTGFKISALNNFEWPDPNNPFLDIKLWEYARHRKRVFVDTGAIGIKHGQGLCGGKGHLMKLHAADPEMKFLGDNLSDYHVEFYKQFSQKACASL